MGEMALIDAGYYTRDGNMYKNDWIGIWTGKGGIQSKDDFLNNPQTQETAVRDYHKKVWGYIEALGLDKYVGRNIGGVEITASGLLAGAHLVGVGELKKFLESNGSYIPTDANGTSITKYIQDLGGYTILFDKQGANNILDPGVEPSRQLFTTATTTRSPIAIDINGDGIRTTNVKDGAYFDHDANGFAEQTGWVNSDDGLLVMDRDGNGGIDSGKELFGDQTILSNGQRASNGFQALSELDSNKDGNIDANDAAFANLKVWQDTDGDGYTSEGELKTLDELGIQSINTGYTDTNITDANGNTIKQTSSFTKSDGTTGAASDVWFQTDKMYSIANEWIDVPDDIAALPDLQGYGNVYDLQQAMARDESGELKGLIEQFMNETDAEARHALITPILYKWTGVENVDPLSRAATKIYGNVIGDARKLATLEAFMGEGYFGTWCWGERDPNPHGPASKILLRAFDELSNSVYSQLMAQTHFKDIMSTISMTWNNETEQIEWDVSATPEALQALYISNPDNAPLAMSEFSDILKLAGDAGLQALEDLRAQGDLTGDGFLQLLAVMGINTTIGNASNNTLQGTGNNDIKRQAKGCRREAKSYELLKLAA